MSKIAKCYCANNQNIHNSQMEENSNFTNDISSCDESSISENKGSLISIVILFP